jgi:hypothetical protein
MAREVYTGKLGSTISRCAYKTDANTLFDAKERTVVRNKGAVGKNGATAAKLYGTFLCELAQL